MVDLDLNSQIIFGLLIAVVYLAVFGIAFAIWLFCKIFRLWTPIQNAFLLWLCFSPMLYNCVLFQQMRRFPRILLTTIAPSTILFLFLAFEFGSYLCGNPAPVNHYHISHMIETESDVDYPSFRIAGFEYGGFFGKEQIFQLKLEEDWDNTMIQKLDSSEKWIKTLDKDGSYCYSINHTKYNMEAEVEFAEYSETVTINISKRKGTYTYRYSFNLGR